MDVVACSSHSLVAFISLPMHSFLAIKNLTFEQVALTYASIASVNAARCLCTLDIITHSSNYTRDTRTCQSVHSTWLHNSVLWLFEGDVVHILLQIFLKYFNVYLIAWVLLSSQIWWHWLSNLLVLTHEVNVLILIGLKHIHVHLFQQLFNLLTKFLLPWLPTLSALYQLFGWINNLYQYSFINVCMLCLFLFLLLLLFFLSFAQLLFFP